MKEGDRLSGIRISGRLSAIFARLPEGDFALDKRNARSYNRREISLSKTWRRWGGCEMEKDDFFHSFERARSYIACRLIREEERARLQEVPYRAAFADLDVVPCFFERRDGKRAAGRPITSRWMACWKIDEERLFSEAFSNMQRMFPPRLYRMDSLMESPVSGSVRSILLNLLKDRFPDTGEEVLDQVAQVLARRLGERMREGSGLQPMWVLGNESWLYGAASLLYPGVLDGFARKVGASFYILPSSVHEVILLPEGGRESRNQLYEMVSNANRRMEDKEKFLSGSVYYYDREKRKIQTL